MEYFPITAKVEIDALTKDIERFHEAYSKWPCKSNGMPDVLYGPGNQKEVIAILLGLDEDENPSKTVFLGSPTLTLPVRTLPYEYRDPWNVPYYIAFDTDNNGVCSTPVGRIMGKGVVVWSHGAGPIKSWEPLSQHYYYGSNSLP